MKYLIARYKDRKSVKDILSLTGVEIALKPIQILKAFVVAKYLGPEMYGILKSVELISMLNKFGNLGFRQTVVRNGVAELAKGNIAAVQRLKNNAFAGELLLSVLLLTAGVISSLFFEDNIVSVAIVLASIGLFTNKLLGIVQTEFTLHRNFTFISKITLYQGLIGSILVIATVPLFTIYSVLIVPVISTIIVIIIALFKTGRFFIPEINKNEFREIFRVSLPLTTATLAFGLFKYTERTLMITMFSLTVVGYFGFAETIVNIFITLFLGSVLKVRGLKVFELISKKKYIQVHKMILKETSLLVGGSMIIILSIYIGLTIFVPLLLPKWEDAIPVAILFSFSLPIKQLSSYIAFAIKSKEINKLRFEPIMQLVITAMLVAGVFALKFTGQLTIINFILIDLAVLLTLQISYVVYYWLIFVRKMVRKVK